jgi:heptosyltransferase-2
MNQKVLIIKSGYSEFLFSKDSNNPSFGDILRITPILHLFKDDHVVWVTDKAAFPLLEGNPYIKELLPLDFSTAVYLSEEKFDTVINLEKNHYVCKLSNMANAWKKYGFRFDEKTNKIEAYDKASEILAYNSDVKIKKESKKSSQELLFELVGKKWKNEEYILGYKPKSKIFYDVGLNTQVGKKFPFKAWPAERWDLLEKTLIKKGFKVSRQEKQPKEVLSDLYKYMDWINSCKLIVTNDSLGLHLAIALKKKVIALFGPTKPEEVHLYNRGIKMAPRNIECVPCVEEDGDCKTGKNCMSGITVERVYGGVLKLIK